jgi:hypothetical protein
VHSVGDLTIMDMKCLFFFCAAFVLNIVGITVDMLALTHVDLHVKCPFVSDFNQIGI